MSLLGIEWYQLEAFDEIANVLLRLGENQLAFEYMRTHSLQSYVLGRVGAGDLFKAVYGNSLVFGHIDYAVEMKRNAPRNYSKTGSPPALLSS